MRIIITLISLALCLTGFASTREKLKQLNTRISVLQAVIQKEKQSRQQFQHQLKSIEIKAANIGKSLSETKAKQKQQRDALNQLNKTIDENQTKLATQKKQLAILLRQAYQMGKEPLLKILLNQTNFAHSQRLLTYYRYLTEAQAHLLPQLQTTLTQLKQDQIKQTTQMQQLAILEKTLTTQRNAVNKTKYQREHIVKQINHHLHSRKQKLANLLADKNLLQNTLRQLAEQNRFGSHFAALKGHLAWPTVGRLIDTFNQPIEHSELKWEGVVINAPQDQPVKAVASGKVIFAKWMPGYGLLLIINHGDGYMTLYGRNHYLYKKVGDAVHAGDVIAAVGESGGYLKSALYFAIRHEAKPLNPKQWCK